MAFSYLHKYQIATNCHLMFAIYYVALHYKDKNSSKMNKLFIYFISTFSDV